jgi:hypothetical protein
LIVDRMLKMFQRTDKRVGEEDRRETEGRREEDQVA